MNINPLIDWPDLSSGAPPLDSVRTEHFLPAIRDAITKAEKDIRAIRDNPAAATFENTVEALEFARARVSRVANVFNNILAVKNNDELMQAGGEIKSELARFNNGFMTDGLLFSRLKSVHDAQDGLALDNEQKMLLKRTWNAFVRSGALLGDNEKAVLGGLDEQIATRTTDFQNNVVKAMGDYKKVIADEDELAGVPERLKNIYRQAAEEEGLAGKWVIRLVPPPSDLLAHADNRVLRREIYEAMNSIACGGAHDNRKVIMDIARLRHERAQLLGYDSHAAYMLDDRMAKDPETVMKFLARGEQVYRPAAEKQMKEIRDFALASDGLADFKPWDFDYYNRKLQEKTFNLNVEELLPYFELENVLRGLRQHVEKLFNITVTEEKTGKYPVYGPDVRAWEITDKQSGALIGVMYTDYYARPGEKNGGAWMEVFRDHGLVDGVEKPAIVINCCNFDKPTAEQPCLLSLEDVRTVFHEFGHGLHGLLSKGKYPSQNGINVKWDFMELPSQLQENWVLEEEVLRTFAQHWKTGETLPSELMKKAIALENFNAGYDGMRMTFFARLDMAWYTSDPSSVKSVEELEKGIRDKSWLFPADGSIKSTSFDHIFSGGADYAAGYYSYQWAEVLDADIFETFRENGLYDEKTAQKLRDTIYSKGGTVDPGELFVAMKGREPDPDALFRREGLLPAKKPREGKTPSRPQPPQPKI
ncbi:MAG: M3 family peptidase [Alphaproteobacteria bacterium]|nr:MAG: M3 family peptidase [Alphaproteobacteria bacterium]